MLRDPDTVTGDLAKNPGFSAPVFTRLASSPHIA